MAPEHMTSSSSTTAVHSAISDFTIDKSRYNQAQYWGRVRHFSDLTDPRTLFTTDSQLKGALTLLDQFRQNTLPSDVTVEQLWKAKKLKEAILHPDTGSPIPLPFRFSFFVPGNLIIVAGMLGARSIPSTVFWQTINQTYNVCVNHANRNASNELSNKQLTYAYLGAVSSSVATAVGLNEWVKRSTFSPALQSTLMRYVPFTAVAVANIFNIGLMRRNEMTLGIDVKDENGQVLGKSATAGKIAIAQTLLSRILCVVPAMLFPPYLMNRLEQQNWLKSRAWLKTPLNLGLIGLSIGLFLPLCIGIFPQNSSISTKRLEPRFHDAKDADGNPVTRAYFNKGL